MPSYMVAVPTNAETVFEFLRDEQDVFRKNYAAVRKEVESNLEPSLYYKIYGREDHQNGVQLKSARKVRLKFDNHFLKKKENSGSLWTVPDIVGFTIVVVFPSDISAICRVIDRLIDDENLRNANVDTSDDPSTPIEADETIETRYGRRKVKNGYFACHYNVLMPGLAPESQPVVEIQIKTLLHDAWGLKSHDLTYKSVGRANKSLVENFDLLGDTLANIDRQSDIIKSMILKNNSVKRRKEDELDRINLDYEFQKLNIIDEPYKGIFSDIKAIDSTSSLTRVLSCERALMKCGVARIRIVSRLYFYLARRSMRSDVLSRAFDAVEVWFDNENDPIQKAVIRHIEALVNLQYRDISSAIEACENSIDLLAAIDSTALPIDRLEAYNDRKMKVLGMLAYCHADLVGSHEGDLADSAKKAEEYLRESLDILHRYTSIDNGIFSDENKIIEALKSENHGWQVFAMLDSEIFVRAQLTNDVKELRDLRSKMTLLFGFDNAPWKKVAESQKDYADYIIRRRMNEIEHSL